MLSPENGQKAKNVDSSERFELGQVVATPGALEALEKAGVSPLRYLYRHVTGDWGDLEAEDKRANDHALLDGSSRLTTCPALVKKSGSLPSGIGRTRQSSCRVTIEPRPCSKFQKIRPASRGQRRFASFLSG